MDVFTCKIDRKEFVNDELSSLSPFFDLETLVAAERKCKNNIFESENTEKMNELNTILSVWNGSTPLSYLLSGNWLRQWSYYIFVRIYEICDLYRKMVLFLV